MADHEGFAQAQWRKSSHSGDGGPGGGDCVEVAALSHETVGLRDSKDSDGPLLILTTADWQALTHRSKAI